MKLKKISGGMAAAIAMLSLSGAAIADHDDCVGVADEIIMKTSWLICDDFGGKYVYDPIWQFQGKKGDGCEVHSKLAKQLYVPHDSPPLGKGKGKGFREAQGAANSLLDHKYESAILHLQNFQSTIEESARLNPDPDAEFPEKSEGVPYTAAELADWWRSWAAIKEAEVAACMPTL